MKNRSRLILLAAISALTLSACSGGAGGHGGGPKGGMDGMPMAAVQQAPTATAVRTQSIKLGSISNEYMYSGSIEPNSEVNVYSSLSGKVKNVNYDVGDKVNAGDILFTMDTTDIESSIKISEANAESARTSVKTAEDNLAMANGASMQTQLENAKNAITNAQNSLKNAKTAVDNANISLSNAKINMDKAENDYMSNLQLYEAGGLAAEAMNNSKDAYEQAQNTYSQAELSLTQAENQYSSADDSLKQAQTNYDILANQTSKENIIKAENSLEQAKAQLNSSLAQLESSKNNLEDATVTSPISGTVSQCNVTAGASLSQGTVPFVIIGTNMVDIKVNIAEQLISSVKTGESVRINIPALSDKEFYGSISTVSPQAENDGTYEVKVSVPNDDGSLKSGMFAEVYFTKEKSENAVVIPRDCVIQKDNESYVFAVENGSAKKCNVVLGIDNGEYVEIKEGISEGMTVVTEGQTYLADGDPVNDVTNKAADKNDIQQQEQDTDTSEAREQDGQMPRQAGKR